MAPDPIIQERVYRALKGDLRSGFFYPGAHAGIFALSRRYGCSETPVREAAWRSVGEALLEPDPRGGFRSPRVTAAALLQMYRWNAAHLASALSLVDPTTLTDVMRAASFQGAGPDHPICPAASLFDMIAAATANDEFIFATDRMNCRLSAVRIAEAQLIANDHQEISMMLDLLSAGSLRSLRHAIARYHRVREAAINQLIEIIASIGKNGSAGE